MLSCDNGNRKSADLSSGQIIQWELHFRNDLLINKSEAVVFLLAWFLVVLTD